MILKHINFLFVSFFCVYQLLPSGSGDSGATPHGCAAGRPVPPVRRPVPATCRREPGGGWRCGWDYPGLAAQEVHQMEKSLVYQENQRYIKWFISINHQLLVYIHGLSLVGGLHNNGKSQSFVGKSTINGL